MEPITSNRYSPPKIRYTAQRLAFVAGCLSGVTIYFWNKQFRQWRHLTLGTAPFGVLTLGLSRWRPTQPISLPTGYVLQKQTSTSGTAEREGIHGACHLLGYTLTRPLAKPCLYQGLAPCHFPDNIYRKAREELVRLLGFELVKYESFQERGREETLLLDGIRIRSSDFIKNMDNLLYRSDLRDFVNKTVEGKKLQEKTYELLKEALNTFQCIRIQVGELKIDSSRKNQVALFFTPFAAYSRHMVLDAFAYLAAGYDVMLTDVRGFGLSEGAPCAEGTRLDTEAMVESAMAWGTQGIVFHGRCMGGFHALYGANYAQTKKYKVAGCFIDRHPSRPSQVLCQEGAGVIDRAVGILLGSIADYIYPYDSEAEIKKMGDLPFGMIRGTKDTFVNPAGVTNKSLDQQKDLHVGTALKVLNSEKNPEKYVLDLPLDHGPDLSSNQKALNKTLDFIFKTKLGA